MTDPASDTTPDAVVEVRMPADVVFVSTLRLTAASLGARCDLTIDDIEDLRLAVDETCALLLPLAVPGSLLDARFVLGQAHLAFEASVQTSGDSEPDRSGFAWTVLGALVSTVDVARDDARLAISVTKVREAATR